MALLEFETGALDFIFRALYILYCLVADEHTQTHKEAVPYLALSRKCSGYVLDGDFASSVLSVFIQPNLVPDYSWGGELGRNGLIQKGEEILTCNRAKSNHKPS